MATKTEYDPVTSIRIPLELKEAVTARAKAEGRSFSQQIVWYVRQQLAAADAMSDGRKLKSR